MSCGSCGTSSGTPSGCRSNGHCESGGCSKMEVYDWLSDLGLPSQKFNIYELSFKNGARKGYYRNDKNLELYTGDMVIVEAASGYDLGKISLSGELVKIQMKKYKVKEYDEEIKSILRIARENELKLMDDARSKEKETMLSARILARNLGLQMKLGDVEFQADCKKATFYYTADGRVDFRELIKVLAAEFKVRIEMRQIGARQEAGRVGGIGACGRELCCSSWLTSFKSVNTSAARYQNLSINQSKLSGQCGRLKCCLNFELDSYLDALKHFPEKADMIETEAGVAYSVKTDVLKGMIYYAYPKTGTFYPVPIDTVKTILEMNKLGKKPKDLVEIAEVEEKEEVIEYADVVGHISLQSLERSGKNKNNKKKPFQNNKSEQHLQGNKGGQQQQQTKPNYQNQNQPQNKPNNGNNNPQNGQRNKQHNRPNNNAQHQNRNQQNNKPKDGNPPVA
jgi:cell fate regulator YaaT (PSP1 superfamily)